MDNRELMGKRPFIGQQELETEWNDPDTDDYPTPWRFHNYQIELIAGWLSGSAGTFVGHPLDTVKVRMQLMSNEGFLSTAVHLVQKEGVSGLYRGLSFPLACSGPFNMIWFAGYANLLKFQDKHGFFKNHKKSYSDKYKRVAVASAGGGLLTIPLANLVDLIKINMQVRTHRAAHRAESFYVVQKIYQNYGFRGLLRGFNLQLYRDVPGSVAYFLTYELLQDVLRKLFPQTKKYSLSHVLVAGGFAGVICWVITLPIDVAKSSAQQMPLNQGPVKLGTSNVIPLLREIAREQGFRSLFKGVLPMSVRAFPTNAVTFLVYELICKCKHEKKPKWKFW